MKRWGIVAAACLAFTCILITVWRVGAPLDRPREWITREDGAAIAPNAELAPSMPTADRTTLWHGLSQRIGAAALSSGLGAEAAASLSAAAELVIDAAASADHRALLATTSNVGGKYKIQDMDLLRALWRRGPTQIQPKGWQTWSDAEIMSHMYRNASTWRSIDLGSVSINQARRHPNGSIDPRSSSLPMTGASIEPRTVAIPELRRALSSGARAVLIEFDLIDAQGVHRTAAIWFCEFSPGLWCIAGSKISGDQEPGEFLL